MSERSATPVTFSREEIQAIEHMLSEWEKPAICPRCRNTLEVDDSFNRATSVPCVVQCVRCRRMAFIAAGLDTRQLDPDK